ncbi:hypothetical protein WBG78_25015 [Chryseolinea sp. T2]|uniref:hypothetical protein n=1 Tax=Chryseolinea sp. T2 TaxID=3129255 RepID=UPI003077C3B9
MKPSFRAIFKLVIVGLVWGIWISEVLAVAVIPFMPIDVSIDTYAFKIPSVVVKAGWGIFAVFLIQYWIVEFIKYLKKKKE